MARALTIDIEGIGRVLLEKSKRSKYLNIFVMPFKGVRVAIPYGISFDEAEGYVRSKVDWIKKHIARIKKVEAEYFSVAKEVSVIDEREARIGLAQRVKELASRHGFSYGKLYIRCQRTRWGSCSHNNNLSLNIKLMSIPRELCEYVILHELMHTRIKNHGKRFWAQLDRIVDGAKSLDKQLRRYNLELL
ncbi:MAG: DUF45 domain-containing protein [Candidatus Omnitrophica bacterium]|nr:DUF45 domain-containing protein [Candidatus Omnitrophota bacterium]